MILLMVFFIGQSAAVAAQYKLSGQQNHPTSGQHPAGHSVPSHCFGTFLVANLMILLMVFFIGQSAAVAAQYRSSGQQNHPTSGQHPAGHSVPSHCFGTFLVANLMILLMVFLAGQSAAVAAQYRLSGQQNHPTSGQHPAGHSVPSHCRDLDVNLTK